MEILKMSAVYDKEEAGGTVFIVGLPAALSEFGQLLYSVNDEVATYPLSNPPIKFLRDKFITLKYLNLSLHAGLLDIKYAEETLYIAGDKDGLEFMADEISHLAENTNPDNYSHIHLDRLSDADKFTVGAIPIIVEALEEDEI